MWISGELLDKVETIRETRLDESLGQTVRYLLRRALENLKPTEEDLQELNQEDRLEASIRELLSSEEEPGPGPV